jgi:transcriptional regulator with PAS, ATPase and Fis domain
MVEQNGLTHLVGQSQALESVRSVIDALRNRSCTVLVTGESGVGKELVAREIHVAGDRRHAPFVPVDCTTLRDSLFESQLFGHVKGAFTGAHRDSLGFFRAADGGTLFFDEIGDMQPHIQAKLLRCIQESAVVPLGSSTSVPVDVRIVAATNCDLRAMVEAGRFREDLFYRLNVIHLYVPPLRQRPEDILILADYFLRRQAELYDEPVKRLSPATEQLLLGYRWPGNVRELANVMERAHVLSAENAVIEPNALPPELHDQDEKQASAPVPTLSAATRNLVVQALEHTQGRKMAAADLLGVERRKLNRMIDKFGIDPVAFR